MTKRANYTESINKLEQSIPEYQSRIKKISREESKQDELNQLKLEAKIAWRSITYLKNPEDMYAKSYFEKHLEYYRSWEITLGQDLAQRYNIKSLVDFGCGCGSYLEGVKQSGAAVQGYEMMYDVIKDILPEEIAADIEYGDVMQVIPCEKFDCAMSIETAEHIVAEKSETLVQNLTNAAQRLIFFTAAATGQRGTGHINCRPREEWIEMFKERNFIYCDEEVEKTREIWHKILASKFRYLIRNLIVMQHGDSI